MIDAAWLIVALCVGYAFGAWVNRKPPVIKDAKINADFKITPEVLHQLNSAMVTGWLEERGLTWMPKGAAFDLNKVQK